MRTHAQIIRDAGTAAVQEAAGLQDKPHTVRSWVQRDSIPGDHWKALSDANIATLEELAAAADARRSDQAAA